MSSPRSGTTIDLARTPSFAITGEAWAGQRDQVRKVEIYADGVRIGEAALASAPRWHREERDWRIVTSAPPGTHSIVACARTASGRSAGDGIVVKVKAPPSTGTVVAPDVTTLRASDLNAITAVTDTKITFRHRPSLSPGQVIVAGLSTATPDGLIRRVTRIDGTRAGYVATTVPAGLDEVLWQADIHLVGVPLEPEAGGGIAKPKVALGGKASARALAAAPAIAAALDYSEQLHLKVGVNGSRGSGSIEVDMGTGVHVAATIDVDIKITATWEWDSLPTITVDVFKLLAHGEMDISANVKATGEGSLDYPSPILRTVKLNRIPLPGPLPLYLRALIDLRLGASFDLSGEVELGASAHGSVSFGVEYRNGHVIPTGTRTFGSSLSVEPRAEEKLEGTAKVYAEATIHPALNLLHLPDLVIRPGLQADLELPCPGRAALAAYLESEVEGPFSIFDLSTGNIDFSLPRASFQLFDGPMWGCTLEIETAVLDKAEVGVPYSFTMEADGGKEPYVWIANDLPPGLTISPDGLIRGTPTAAGDFDVQFAIADDDGDTVETTIALTVKPKLAIETTTLPNGTAGTPYQATIHTTGGGDAPLWIVSSGSLPAGLSLGATTGELTGTPTTAGSSTFTVRVQDMLGGVATATLQLLIEPKLPDPVDDTPPPPPPPLPPCAGACGSSWGDPHLVTYDGARYDFQQVGEYITTKSTVDDLQVQVRQQSWYFRGSVSVNTAIAFSVAGHRVGVYLTPGGTDTLVDGAPVTPAATGTALPGGGTVALDTAQRRETITWPDGSIATITYVPGSYLTLSLNLATARRGHLVGLLGDADGIEANDLVTRAGVMLAYPAPLDQLYGAYSASWRLSQAESLFDYAAGKSTATYTDTTFPSSILTVADLPEAQRSAAEALCRAAGITQNPTLENCILDVAVSGDPGAVTAAILAQLGSQSTSSIIATSAVGDPWTSPGNTSGTAELSYGHIGCTSVASQQVCAGGLWPVLPGAPWIWAQRNTLSGQSTVTFRKTVTLTAAQAARSQTLYASADNEVLAYLGSTSNLVLFGGLGSTPNSKVLHLREGDNTLIFQVSNYGGDDPVNNPAGLAWKLVLN